MRHAASAMLVAWGCGVHVPPRPTVTHLCTRHCPLPLVLVNSGFGVLFGFILEFSFSLPLPGKSYLTRQQGVWRQSFLSSHCLNRHTLQGSNGRGLIVLSVLSVTCMHSVKNKGDHGKVASKQFGGRGCEGLRLT